MKKFSIVFIHKSAPKQEYVEARTSTSAIKKLMSELRERNLPVRIKVVSITEVKAI